MRPGTWIVIGLLSGGLLAACASQSGSNPTPGQGYNPPTATIARLPTLPPEITPTELPALLPGSDTVEEGLPYDVTGYELIAIRSGEAVYSGYTCTLSQVGCACDQPVVQRASFAFVTETTMSYKFFGSGFGAEWLMTRLAPNQWSYEIAMVNEEGGKEGVFFVLLTFEEDGFVITEGADLDEGGFVACPDIYFRRVRSGPTEQP